jgi:hypothetical protein
MIPSFLPSFSFILFMNIHSFSLYLTHHFSTCLHAIMKEPFPVGMNVRSRSSREQRLPNAAMNNDREGSNHESPSNTSAINSREDSGHGGSFFLSQSAVDVRMAAAFAASAAHSPYDYFSVKTKGDEEFHLSDY